MAEAYFSLLSCRSPRLSALRIHISAALAAGCARLLCIMPHWAVMRAARACARSSLLRLRRLMSLMAMPVRSCDILCSKIFSVRSLTARIRSVRRASSLACSTASCRSRSRVMAACSVWLSSSNCFWISAPVCGSFCAPDLVSSSCISFLRFCARVESCSRLRLSSARSRSVSASISSSMRLSSSSILARSSCSNCCRLFWISAMRAAFSSSIRCFSPTRDSSGLMGAASPRSSAHSRCCCCCSSSTSPSCWCLISCSFSAIWLWSTTLAIARA
mmetsp:Transcript_38544/g.94818  ORF Transcript_38544/g.94818 Transcript_38544/m.94818 type:complete len:274 (-) Transcript_38544:1160-1981(-)